MTPRVLVLIKPDGLQKNIVGEIIGQFLSSRLRLVGLKLVQASKPKAHAHYGHLRREKFFKDIAAYLMGDLHQGHPVVAMVLEGAGAIKKCRQIAGATNPEAADPRSIRGRFGRITTKGVFENLVHVSSSTPEAHREIALWFKSSEILK